MTVGRTSETVVGIVKEITGVESEALGVIFMIFMSITVFPTTPGPFDGNDFTVLSCGFVVTVGRNVGAKPKMKTTMTQLQQKQRRKQIEDCCINEGAQDGTLINGFYTITTKTTRKTN